MNADEGLRLADLDRLLSPIRRLAAYGVTQPDNVRYAEHNLDRWVQPLLAFSLPDPLREHVLSVAGQVSGFDEAADRQARFERIRGEIRQLDQVLGLPLASTMPRARSRRRGAPHKPRVPREQRPTAKPKARGRKAPERIQPKTPTEEVSPAPRRSTAWNGDLGISLRDLDLPGDLGERLLTNGLESVGDVVFHVPETEVTHRVSGAGRELEPGLVAVGGRRVAAWTTLQSNGERTTTAVLRGAADTTLRWRDTASAAAWLTQVRSGDRTIALGHFDGESVWDPVVVQGDGRTVTVGLYGFEQVTDAELQMVLGLLVPYLDRVRDPLPTAYREGLPSLAEALTALHGAGDRDQARRRLAHDEIVLTALGAAFAAQQGTRSRGIQHSILHTHAARLLDAADATLSDEQELVFDDIKRELRGSRPMRRVVFGEPGGGKGLLATCTAALVAESKCQVAFTSSDPVALEQCFAFSQPLLEAAGLVARMVDTKDTGALDALKRGQIHIAFGGPELVAPHVEFRRLGLVISKDDQAMAPLDARSAPAADLLAIPTEMPSTSALVAEWTGFNLSYLQGVKAPAVLVKTSSQRVSAYAQARMALLEQHQVAILFPLIDDRDALDPAEASRVMKALANDALPGARLSLYHGAMPRKERQQTYQDFRHRRADALLSTLALEASAPIPGLRVAVVEHADRMTDSRLARLVGLGVEHISLVVSDDTTPEAMEQLKRTVTGAWSRAIQTNGLPSVQHADLSSNTPANFRALARGQNRALEILNSDAQLRSGAHADLLRFAWSRWNGWYAGDPCPLPKPSAANPQRKRRRRRRRR